MWDPYAEFQSETLPNGLTVHAAHWPGRPWVAMGFLIHSGAEHDPIGLEGLAHFVEHVVSENTHIPNREIEIFFENCGGNVNLGVTGYPKTHYRFFVPAKKAILAKAFSIFGQMLLSAKLEKNIERERQIIIEEFHRSYPIKAVLDLNIHKRKVLYTSDFLGRSIRPLGSLESVGRITQNDLQSYYDGHYTPANMSVVAVGGMQLPELIELLSESPFAMSKRGARTALPIPATSITPPSETHHIFEISKHFTAPIEVGGYESVAKIPGSINKQVVRIINGMLQKVLFREAREQRAWTYSINSSWYNYRHFYEFTINCPVLAVRAINDIEEVIESCITMIGDQENLFEQVKRRALARNFMIDPSGEDICSDVLKDLSEYQRIISLAEIVNDLQCVTMNDIRNTLEWFRPERRWTRITRP